MNDHENFVPADFSALRLLIEGAIVLYEVDALPLFRIAGEAGAYEAQRAFDSIGTALYQLRDHVRNLESAPHVSKC